MEEDNYGKLLLIGAIIVGAFLIAAACSSPRTVHAPCCDVEKPTLVGEWGPWYSEEFLEENPEYREESYKCSKYYENEANKE